MAFDIEEQLQEIVEKITSKPVEIDLNARNISVNELTDICKAIDKILSELYDIAINHCLTIMIDANDKYRIELITDFVKGMEIQKRISIKELQESNDDCYNFNISKLVFNLQEVCINFEKHFRFDWLGHNLNYNAITKHFCLLSKRLMK